MNTDKVVTLIETIIGKTKLTKDKKEQIKTIIELAVNKQFTTVEQKEVIAEPKPNEVDVKADENEIDLQNVPHFRFPQELNVAFEGQEGTQKMKIFPDGFSEKQNGNKKD